MTIRIRGLPASFGISKPIAGRMTTAVHDREPVPQSGAAHRSNISARAAANHKSVVKPSAVAQAPSTTPSPRSSCAAGT